MDIMIQPSASRFRSLASLVRQTLRGTSSSPSTSSIVVARRKQAAAASLAQPPFRYTFDHGMAHFIMIDTETDFDKGLVGPEEKGGSQNLVNDGPFDAQNQQIQFL
ncbi:hypothetical protein DL93DRAFT_2084616 [Clavulina sp. PMI_390]|nr:hypothetical protein DL93DRAFT_2084616 [Clavulina sp. PMI_390]